MSLLLDLRVVCSKLVQCTQQLHQTVTRILYGFVQWDIDCFIVVVSRENIESCVTVIVLLLLVSRYRWNPCITHSSGSLAHLVSSQLTPDTCTTCSARQPLRYSGSTCSQ